MPTNTIVFYMNFVLFVSFVVKIFSRFYIVLTVDIADE